MTVPELSSAGQNYGAAMCLAPDRASVPFSQLTADEQTCVRAVGTRWEADVDRALGYGGAPAPPDLRRATLQGAAGRLGTLTYADGVVTVCWDVPTDAGASRCQAVGSGLDAFQAVRATLGHFGVQAVDVR